MKRIKIVIVENDEDEQMFMEEGINASDIFDIKAILRNGDELFEYMENNLENLPELVLSDLNMPGKNGYDIINEMKETEAYANIPVIILSTSSTRTIIDKCMALGATEYMIKPDTFNEYLSFAHKLHEVIKQKIGTRI